MAIQIYQGRSAVIEYRLFSSIPLGAIFTFTIKRNRGGPVLLQTSAINHDFDLNTGDIELVDSDTVNLPIGMLLAELQADVEPDETYVVIEPQSILVLNPLRDG